VICDPLIVDMVRDEIVVFDSTDEETNNVDSDILSPFSVDTVSVEFTVNVLTVMAFPIIVENAI
jgi:hypothetical protein